MLSSILGILKKEGEGELAEQPDLLAKIMPLLVTLSYYPSCA